MSWLGLIELLSYGFSFTASNKSWISDEIIVAIALFDASIFDLSFLKSFPIDCNLGDLRFHLTLWPTAINDESARGVNARTDMAENADQVVDLGRRALIIELSY